MSHSGRDILDLLKFELSFLEEGGYGRPRHSPWLPPAIFQDSPVCPNFGNPTWRHPCTTCALFVFVPNNRHRENIPCRFIPISPDGRTIEDFYRTETQFELERVLSKWLQAQIKKIEDERRVVVGSQGVA